MKYAPGEQYIEELKAERDRLSVEVDLLRRERDDANDRGDRYKAALEELAAMKGFSEIMRLHAESALRPVNPDVAVVPDGDV